MVETSFSPKGLLLIDEEAHLRRDMAAAHKGDAQAAKRLFTALLPVLRQYVRRQLARYNQTAIVEDVVQEALLAIHTKMHTHHEGEAVMPWVYAITRYKMIDMLRRHKHMNVSVDDPEFNEAVMSQEQGGSIEVSYDVRKLLDTLDPVQRALVVAVKMHGASVAELARQYGYSESNVKVIVHRGMQKLSALVQGAAA